MSNTNDNAPGSLRQAIVDAAPGDSIAFASSVTGAVALTSGELLIGKTVSIIGPAAGVTVSGNNASRVLHITNATVSVSGLTIANGNAGYGAAALIEADGTLLLNNCSVSANASGIAGGGVFNSGTATGSQLHTLQ